MAKIALSLTVKKNDGSALVTGIASGDKDTFSEAKAAIVAQFDARVQAATQNAQDFQDAQAALNL